MSLTDWALTAGAKGAIRDAETDGKVAGWAAAADALVKANFPQAADEIKTLVVRHVVFPFARAFLKDVPGAFDKEKSKL